MIVGQKKLRERIKESLPRPAHAYVILGAKGSGKRSLAKFFAQSLLCQSQDSPCGSCNACLSFEAGANLDFFHLKKSEKSVIEVDKIRSLLRYDLHLEAQQGRYKVFLIEADDLNEAGQNALLKSLEEPPANVIFILTSRQRDLLLKTIQSRAVIWQLEAYSRAELEEIVGAKTKREDLDLILNFAAGNVKRAIELAEDESFFTLRKKIALAFLAITQSTRADLLGPLSQELLKIKDLELVYQIWQSLILDLLLAKLKSDSFQNLDLKEQIKSLAGSISEGQLQKASQLILQSQRAIKANVNQELNIAHLLLALRKELRDD